MKGCRLKLARRRASLVVQRLRLHDFNFKEQKSSIPSQEVPHAMRERKKRKIKFEKKKKKKSAKRKGT